MHELVIISWCHIMTVQAMIENLPSNCAKVLAFKLQYEIGSCCHRHYFGTQFTAYLVLDSSPQLHSKHLFIAMSIGVDQVLQSIAKPIPRSINTTRSTPFLPSKTITNVFLAVEICKHSSHFWANECGSVPCIDFFCPTSKHRLSFQRCLEEKNRS